MNKLFSILTVVIFSITAFSCDSPLSDTELDDPSLIRPWLAVVKTMDNGARVVEYTADIYDKNLSLVSLKNGSVKIANVEMGKRTYIFGGEGYYLAGESSIQHKLNTSYTFIITLSDGSQYPSTVTTQSKDLYEFIAPASHNRTESMTVTWKETDPLAQMHIVMNYSFRTDTSNGLGSRILTINNPSTGSFTINSAEFYTDQGTMFQTDLTLVSEIQGTIDPRFRFGSEIVSQLRYTRKVTLN